MTSWIHVYTSPPLGTALSVHIPLCWVYWHRNYLQHNPASGHSASANAYTEVLLLDHQPCRQQRYHTKGPWWVIINILDLFQQKSGSVASFKLWSIILIWIIWTVFRSSEGSSAAQCVRIIGSEPITVIVCSHKRAISSPTFEMTHHHMEVLACQLLGPWPSLKMTVKQTRHINTVILLRVPGEGVRPLKPGPVAWLASSMKQYVIRLCWNWKCPWAVISSLISIILF